MSSRSRSRSPADARPPSTAVISNTRIGAIVARLLPLLGDDHQTGRRAGRPRGVPGRIHCAAQNAGFDTLIDVDLSFSSSRPCWCCPRSTESLPIHEIADSLRLSVGAAGRNIDRLVREGLVDRQEDSADRRIKRISLTARVGI